MKLFLRSTLLFILVVNSLSAQNRLSSSNTSGSYTYIYKLTDQETYQIAAKSKEVITDAFLHTLVDSFYNVNTSIYRKKLPFGNYLQVEAVKNKLNYKLLAVNNVLLKFINNRKDFQFAVTDLKGNLISNAAVKVGKNSTVKYHNKAGLYQASAASKPAVIRVNYNNVNSYFTFEEEEKHQYNPGKYARSPAKQNAVKPKVFYQGYMVFNKPMYKPLDTVKFKAYLVTAKGEKLENKPLKVEIYTNYTGPGRSLATLKPYREGGYESSFVLSDSLNLRLDRPYDLVLKEERKSKWEEVYRKSFRYEDYELKSVNFLVRTTKEIHRPGDPVGIFLKATDENELAVADGRVEVLVTALNVSEFHSNRVFVKDSLWKTSILLDPVGETKLVLPDSIFPKADLNFSIKFTFLNSNNERRTVHKSLSYELGGQQIKHEFRKDSLYLDYLVNGKPEKQRAVIVTSYPDGEEEDSVTVELPAAIKVNYKASDYFIRTGRGYNHSVFLDDLKPDLSVRAVQRKDSLQISTVNVHKVPFWYTVFSGDKVFFKGYSTGLDTIIRHSSAKAAQIKLNYFWDGEEISTQATAFYMPNILNVRLLAPDLVYPGQTVNMQVKVTDLDGKPVDATDVTAFAHTAKFKNAPNIALPNFGKRFFQRKEAPELESDDMGLSGELKLNWNKWGKELNLDNIEYYKFTQTNDLYSIQEKGNDTLMAIVSPFVVSNGEIVPVNIVYIDEVPVFFDQANHLQRYAFYVKPGRHNIKMRISGFTIHLDDYEFLKGQKTIISVAADLLNAKARVAKAPLEMTDDEAALLTKYMLRIENNFMGEKATLSSENNVQLLALPIAGDYNGINNYGVFRTISSDNAVLAGPFPENLLRFKSGVTDMHFVKEPGYTYTFLPGLLKQKSYADKFGFTTRLTGSANGGSNYKDYPFKNGEIDSLWDDYLDLRSRTTVLFRNTRGYGKENGRLQMKLDTSIANRMPYLKNVIIYKYNEPDFLHIYPGNTSHFNQLGQGQYRIFYLFKNNDYFVAEDVAIKPGGVNFYHWKDLTINRADSLSIRIDREIKSVNQGGNNSSSSNVQLNIVQNINGKYLDPKLFPYTMTGRVLDAKDKSAVRAAAVKVKGTDYGSITDAEGRFSIRVPERGKLVVSFIGYDLEEVDVLKGHAGDILLDAASQLLEEVVVVGYGTVRRQNMTGSVVTLSDDKVYNFGSIDVANVSQLLQGRVAGVSVNSLQEVAIRGINSIPALQKPLIIVDGLPFNGDLNSLDQNQIASMSILKDQDATAIYGSRGAAGVIIIKTKTGNLGTNQAGEAVPQQQTMRTNFSDYAIWQPKLLTDAEGRASFTVKFPDDITSWTTSMVAMNGRKQGGVAETSIRSFKTLSANFVSPQFALEGDSMQVIGKLMNYSNADEVVNRRFSYNGTELLSNSVTFKNAKIDTVTILAKGVKNQKPDSLQFEYTMKQDNGYFDGEIRKIPLLQKGVTETKGFFEALTSDTSVTYNFEPALGKVILRAEVSLFPVLLDEIEKLRNYEYLCNEQLASKLKALLLEKTVRKYLGEHFKEEKHIKELLKKLQNNRRPEGTWGWWQNSGEEMWISLHVVEALLNAQKQGYEVKLDKDKLYNYLVSKLANSQSFDQVYGIRLINLLNDKYYIRDWVNAVDKQRRDLEQRHALERKNNPALPVFKLSLYEKLQLMQLKQKAGMEVDLKWLISSKKETMFGSSYWGEEGHRFWDNSIQNTLLAYQVLKTNGGYKPELERIQRYFLEQRKDGQWRNTYESSLILETILPELLLPGKQYETPELTLNGTETAKVFPYTKTIDPAGLRVDKKGAAPVYFTAYQQFNNPDPKKAGKDFMVTSTFEQQGEMVTKLKAGTLGTLKVNVEVRADADYVMIEIPIPAGCSYENKTQNYWGPETHREYFKHKTAIFCTKLKQGKYTFTVQLMPRYSGIYHLNPAKAEMMYFPVFYGREGMKKVAVN